MQKLCQTTDTLIDAKVKLLLMGLGIHFIAHQMIAGSGLWISLQCAANWLANAIVNIRETLSKHNDIFKVSRVRVVPKQTHRRSV